MRFLFGKVACCHFDFLFLCFLLASSSFSLFAFCYCCCCCLCLLLPIFTSRGGIFWQTSVKDSERCMFAGAAAAPADVKPPLAPLLCPLCPSSCSFSSSFAQLHLPFLQSCPNPLAKANCCLAWLFFVTLFQVRLLSCCCCCCLLLLLPWLTSDNILLAYRF